MVFWMLRKSIKVDENNEMVRYPWNWNYGWGVPAHQILESFFDKQNITPSWIDCDYDWGGLNSSTGLWTGAVGEVFSIICISIDRILIKGTWLIKKINRRTIDRGAFLFFYLFIHYHQPLTGVNSGSN